MKTIFSLICLLIFTLINAQDPQRILTLEDPDYDTYFKQSSKIPIVTGKILNLKPEDISKIKISYSIVTPLYEFQTKKTTRVMDDGTFNLQLDYPYPYQQIWFGIGDTLYTCLYANSDLLIEIDAAKVDKKQGIQFSGDGLKFLGNDGELNHLINNHILFKRNQQLALNKELNTTRSERLLPFDEYLKKYNEIYDKFNAIDKEFLMANPSKYSFIIENERLSSYYANLFSRFLNEKMPDEIWEKIKNHRVYSISNEGMLFYRYLLSYISSSVGKYRFSDWNALFHYSKIDDTGKMIIDSMTYYQKTSNLKAYNKLAGKAFTTFSDTLAAIDAVKTIEFLDKNFIPSKADYLKIKLGSMDQDEQIIIDEIVLKNLTTEWCTNVLNTQYQNVLSNSFKVRTILKESKPISSKPNIGQNITEFSFGARLYTFNKGNASELLSNLKNEFKDKAILLDFWATWCAPCLSEMPYSKKLQNETRELPIEFIYLCTSNNSTQEKWKSKIAELKIPGTHIFVEESIENDLMRLFSGQGFPTYVLINSRGNIKKEFQRPSMTNVKTLNDLISQK
jgi:thiol-disulfide isomerase/thioredoxin